MVKFVNSTLLGTHQEFTKRFVTPITNDQYTDSTPDDIKKIKEWSRVLHDLLDICLQRHDYNVLAPMLKPKHEFVLYIRLNQF